LLLRYKERSSVSMVNAVHHVQVLTRDSQVLVHYLETTLGMDRQAEIEIPRSAVAELLRWTVTEGQVRSTILGSGHRGLVEVVECPEAGDSDTTSQPTVGALQLAFAVPDLPRCLEDARRLGAVHVVGPKTLTQGSGELLIASLELAGVRLQLSESAAGSPASPDHDMTTPPLGEERHGGQ
jgi:hypothetical protein